MKQDANDPFFSTFAFWFTVAFLINFAGNFLLFVYSETSKQEPDFKTNYTTIYGIVTIFKNILLCIAFAMKENFNRNTNNNLIQNVNPSIFNPYKTDSL
jgi:hypothetical protein